MANGRFDYYSYQDDSGVVWRVRVRAAKAVVVGMVVNHTSTKRLPRGIQPRYMTAQGLTTGRRLEWICPTRSGTAWTTVGTFSFEGETFKVISRRGERWRKAY